MEKVPLGRTGLKVSRLGFGCIRFRKDRLKYEDVEAALNRALDLGVNFLDTARRYGESEEWIGRALKARRDEFFIATKTGAFTQDEAAEHIDTSLKMLKTDYIDLYQLHSVSDPERFRKVMAPGGAFFALDAAKAEGKIRHIGASSHRSHQTMRNIIRSAKFETIMLAYNILDQEAVGREIIPEAAEAGMGIIIMKPFAGGALTQAKSENLTLHQRRTTLAAEALRWVLSNPLVNTVIPGMENLGQVEENVAVAGDIFRITEEERVELLRELRGLEEDFCRQCGYCLPCTAGINIPEVFRLASMRRRFRKSEVISRIFDEEYERLEVKPEECVDCGECEERCPYALPIREKLKKAMEVFQGRRV